MKTTTRKFWKAIGLLAQAKPNGFMFIKDGAVRMIRQKRTHDCPVVMVANLLLDSKSFAGGDAWVAGGAIGLDIDFINDVVNASDYSLKELGDRKTRAIRQRLIKTLGLTNEKDW